MREQQQTYVVEACARLHFGLLQTAAERTRRFGGVGLFLRDPAWKMTLSRGNDLRLAGIPLPSELIEIVHTLMRDWRSRHQSGVELRITSAVPLHVGLGSKTSFVQALSAGLAAIAGEADEAPALFARSGRGRTSGIGSSAPLGGGFTLDVGVRGAETWLPSSSATWCERSATAAKFRFPECRILLARETETIGLSGLAEQKLFGDNLPSSEAEIDKLAAVVLFDLIPSITTEDLPGVREAIRRMQDLGFKRIEWGAQPPLLHQLRQYIETDGGACALSSMGPTIAIFSDNSPGVVAEAIRKEFGDVFELNETGPMNDTPVRAKPLNML